MKNPEGKDRVRESERLELDVRDNKMSPDEIIEGLVRYAERLSAIKTFSLKFLSGHTLDVELKPGAKKEDFLKEYEKLNDAYSSISGYDFSPFHRDWGGSKFAHDKLKEMSVALVSGEKTFDSFSPWELRLLSQRPRSFHDTFQMDGGYLETRKKLLQQLYDATTLEKQWELLQKAFSVTKDQIYDGGAIEEGILSKDIRIAYIQILQATHIPKLSPDVILCNPGSTMFDDCFIVRNSLVIDEKYGDGLKIGEIFGTEIVRSGIFKRSRGTGDRYLLKDSEEISLENIDSILEFSIGNYLSKKEERFELPTKIKNNLTYEKHLFCRMRSCGGLVHKKTSDFLHGTAKEFYDFIRDIDEIFVLYKDKDFINMKPELQPQITSEAESSLSLSLPSRKDLAIGTATVHVVSVPQVSDGSTANTAHVLKYRETMGAYEPLPYPEFAFDSVESSDGKREFVRNPLEIQRIYTRFYEDIVKNKDDIQREFQELIYRHEEGAVKASIWYPVLEAIFAVEKPEDVARIFSLIKERMSYVDHISTDILWNFLCLHVAFFQPRDFLGSTNSADDVIQKYNLSDAERLKKGIDRKSSEKEERIFLFAGFSKMPESDSRSYFSEEEYGIIAYKYIAWARRVADAIKKDPMRGIEELGRIFYRECGYASASLLEDNNHEWYENILSTLFSQEKAERRIERHRRYHTWKNLALTSVGDCAAKYHGICVVAGEVSAIFEREQETQEGISCHISELYAKKELTDHCMAELRLESNNKRLLLAKFFQKSNGKPYDEQKAFPFGDPGIFLFGEEYLTLHPAGVQVPHVRVIARVWDKKKNTATYWAIEKSWRGLITPWKPSKNCVYKNYGEKVFDKQIAILRLLTEEFNLPPTFSFAFYPNIPVEISFDNNLFRETRDPPGEGKVERLIKFVRQIQETSREFSEEVLAISQESVVFDAALRQSEVRDPSLNIIKLKKEEKITKKDRVMFYAFFEKCSRYVREHPFVTAGAAVASVLGYAVLTEEPQFTERDEPIASLANDPRITAAVHEQAEITAAEKPETVWEDLERSKALMHAIADGLDLVFGGHVNREGMLTEAQLGGVVTVNLTENTKKDIESNPLKIEHISWEGGADRKKITMVFDDEIRTLAPSFWIPVLKRLSTEPSEVIIRLSGKGLDASAVMGGFSVLWNKALVQEHAPKATFTLFINDERVFTHLVQEEIGKRNSLSYSDAFVVDPRGGLQVTRPLQDTAWDTCATVFEQTPSAWHTPAATVWTYPVCEGIVKQNKGEK